MRRLLASNFVFVSATVRRSVLEDVGGFDESLATCEDYDLWLRILASGAGAARVQGRHAIKRERQVSLSRNFVSMLRDQATVYTQVSEDERLPADLREAAERRAAETRRYIEAETGNDQRLAARVELHRKLSAVRKRLAPATVWHRGVPRELRGALPQGFEERRQAPR